MYVYTYRDSSSASSSTRRASISVSGGLTLYTRPAPISATRRCFIYISICMYVCMYICILHIYTYNVHTHTNTHTHTHTHTHRCWFWDLAACRSARRANSITRAHRRSRPSRRRAARPSSSTPTLPPCRRHGALLTRSNK